MGFFNFLRSLFGEPPAESGGSTRVTGTEPVATRPGQYPTTYEKNNVTMLKQLDEARKYRGIIEEAARLSRLSPAVICGIGSRESHWGLILRPPGPGGTGDHNPRRPRGDRRGSLPPDGGGFGRGLMQIDYDWHEFARSGAWQDPRANLMYACEVLNQSRRFFEQRGVRRDILETAILAAYNSGSTATYECIQTNQDIDCRTTGRDYSADVLNRAGWFQLHGWR